MLRRNTCIVVKHSKNCSLNIYIYRIFKRKLRVIKSSDLSFLTVTITVICPSLNMIDR